MEDNTNIATRPEPTMAEMVKELYKQNAVMEDRKEVKTFKLPWSSRVNSRAAKVGYTSVLILRNNRNVEFIKAPIEDGTIIVDGIPRISTVDYTLNYKGKPFIIIPEWSLKPFSPTENYEQTVQDKMNVAGRKVVLAKLEKEIIKPKKGMGGMGGWILLIVIVVGAAYMLLKGGLF